MSPTTSRLVEVLNTYEIRHLAAHLYEGRRQAELCRLLRLETDGTNSWYEAKSALGDIDGYVEDVGRGWELVYQLAQDRLRRGLSAPDIGLEVRYLLCLASLNSLAANIPPSLISELVAGGVWTTERAIGYARRVPDPEERAEALALLAEEHLNGSLRIDILSEALSAARRIRDAYREAGAVARLALKLPVELIAAAQADRWARSQEVEDFYSSGGPAITTHASQLAIVPEAEVRDELRGIASDLDTAARVDRLTGLLPSISAATAQQALDVALSIEGELQRSLVLARLVPYLVALGRRSEAERALGSLAHTGRESTAIDVLLQSDSSGTSDRVDWEIERANSVESPYWRAVLLGRAARTSPDSRKRGLLDEARAAGETVGDARTRATALLAFTPYLDDAPEALVDAMIASIPDERLRACAAACVPHEVDLGDLADRSWRIWVAATRLDRIVSPTRRRDIAFELARQAQQVEDPLRHSAILSHVLTHLDQDRGAALVTDALVRYRGLPNEHDRARALVSLVRGAGRGAMHTIVSEIDLLLDPDDRSTALIEIGPRLVAHGWIDEGRRIPSQISDPYWRAEALRRVVVSLASIGAEQDALELLGDLEWHHATPEFLGALAMWLSPTGVQQLEARLEADETDGVWFARAVAVLAVESEHNRDAMVEGAVQRAAAISNPDRRVDAMTALLSVLPDATVGQMLKELAQVDPSEAGRRLVERMHNTSEGARNNVEAADDAERCALALIALASRSPTTEAALSRAVNVSLNAIPDPARRLELIADLDATAHDRALLHSLMHSTLMALTDLERSAVLENLSNSLSAISAIGGVSALIEVARSIDDTARWWG